jgi:cytochrome c-type biogenesis protein CcmH/NrfF
MRRLAALLALLALALPAGTSAQEPQTSLADIEDEVMCPVCGVTLELATEAPQAIQEREFIRERVAAGESKEEIKDALVAEFGPEVLAVPEAEGFDLAAWLVPGIAIAIAAVAILFALRRWRRDADQSGDGPAEPPAAALSDEDAERLDADLARYDR